MGLDAAVFRNIRNLEEEFGPGLFEIVDCETGEAELKPDAPAGVPDKRRFAESRRIGNIAAVGGLRNAIRAILPEGANFILEKVIYSGTHSGDQIDLSLLPQLRAEVERLKGHGSNSTDGIPQFMDDMLALIESAEREQNPIVFI